MIQKLHKVEIFSRLLTYLNKPDAEFLGGTVGGWLPSEMAREFELIARLNTKCQKPVFHVSLSLSPKEGKLENWKWRAIAQEYLDGMGFDQNQYAVYHHHDCSHDHIHIVANRVHLGNLKTVSEQWDYYRGQEVLREIETSYGLQPETSSWECLRKGSNQPAWKKNRELYQVACQFLQNSIEEAAQQADNFSDLIGFLEEEGVTLELCRSDRGEVQGVRYQCEWEGTSLAVAGSQLGKAFSYRGLQQYLGVSLEEPSIVEPSPESDPKAAPSLSSPVKSPQDSDWEQQLTGELYRIIEETGCREVAVANNGKIGFDANSAMLTYTQQEQVLFQSCRESQGHWRVDRNRLQTSQMKQLIEQADSIIADILEQRNIQNRKKAKRKDRSSQLEV